MRNASELKAISAKFGIAIPKALESLIDSGATSYSADFNKNSSQILTTNPPALWATYDLEWLDDNEPSGVLSEWLAPEYQNGNFFAPFAQSGGGDIYALVKLASGEQGCAVLWRDNPESEINYLSFEDFVCGRFLDAMTDLSHLEDDLSPEEAVICLRKDYQRTTKDIPAAKTSLLDELIARDPMTREFKHGPNARPIQVLSLISQDEHAQLIFQFERANPRAFPVVAPWDIK
ncbi:MAG: SMI1/KNR4 family protein [Helicobacteraceae bacterium]|jgi:hypothetical protein|nr:SMI1/KNR4 family protein [Helicobacteraceae bacterium]